MGVSQRKSVPGMSSQTRSLTKRCRKCGQTKPLEKFHRHCWKLDGRSSWCKVCDAKRDRALQQTSIRRLKTRDNSRRYRALGLKRDSDLRHVLRYQAKYPERRKAGNAVTRAVRNGTLLRPTVCSKCRKRPERGIVQAHHHKGYDKPLVVQWLCVQCHADAHRLRRATTGGRT